MRPAIFFFVDPEVWATEEEVEGGVIGDLLGVGDGAGARDRGAGVGGAKGVPEVEGGGLESAASAASASASCDQSNMTRVICGIIVLKTSLRDLGVII